MAAGTTNWKNVNNWHWVEKNCFPWAKEHFKSTLVGLSVTDAARQIEASVTELVTMTGDADINQRKGKLITVYDVAITLAWKGTVGGEEGKKVAGRLVFPELMHDTDLRSLEVEVTAESSDSDSAAAKELIRTALVAEVKKKFASFSEDMIAANGRDVHIPESDMKGHPVTTLYKPQPPAPAAATAASNGAAANSTVKGKLTTLSMTVEFVCSAADLYQTLLEPGRVQAWSRGPAKIGPQVGAEVALFGGNVTGKIVDLVPNKKIVQTWRLKTWPGDHHSNVTIDLEEQRESVKLILTQREVPIGELDITRKNWEAYYWNGIKSAFGFGAVGF
ncbi:activator of Hsp90 ATPase [Zopfochytrium polystomum]|nr:activator of Hsp90 ATPase [Zopfochytrium polystomum]